MTQPSFFDYLSYQPEDFVMDTAFQQWVMHPDADSKQFWQEFLITYPDKRAQIEEAAEIVRNIRYQSHTLSLEKQEKILQNVYASAEKTASAKRHWLFPFHTKYRAAAATLTLLLLSTFVFWYMFPAYETYETGYQENKTIQLADGSEVLLNANTRLKVSINLDADQPREVWLDGEAYFQVKHLGKAESEGLTKLKNFIVHTDNFDIEVLGTSFNVSNRARKSEVLLKSGKVKVASQQIDQTQILQPGDLLALSGEDRNFQLTKAESDTNLSWRDNYFIFENTPLDQVARAIEAYYGLEVEIDDQQLKKKIFTARISRDELLMLLKAIEVSFDVKIKREQKKIQIQP